MWLNIDVNVSQLACQLAPSKTAFTLKVGMSELLGESCCCVYIVLSRLHNGTSTVFSVWGCGRVGSCFYGEIMLSSLIRFCVGFPLKFSYNTYILCYYFHLILQFSQSVRITELLGTVLTISCSFILLFKWTEGNHFNFRHLLNFVKRPNNEDINIKRLHRDKGRRIGIYVYHD